MKERRKSRFSPTTILLHCVRTVEPFEDSPRNRLRKPLIRTVPLTVANNNHTTASIYLTLPRPDQFSLGLPIQQLFNNAIISSNGQTKA